MYAKRDAGVIGAREVPGKKLAKIKGMANVAARCDLSLNFSRTTYAVET